MEGPATPKTWRGFFHEHRDKVFHAVTLLGVVSASLAGVLWVHYQTIAIVLIVICAVCNGVLIITVISLCCIACTLQYMESRECMCYACCRELCYCCCGCCWVCIHGSDDSEYILENLPPVRSPVSKSRFREFIQDDYPDEDTELIEKNHGFSSDVTINQPHASNDIFSEFAISDVPPNKGKKRRSGYEDCVLNAVNSAKQQGNMTIDDQISDKSFELSNIMVSNHNHNNMNQTGTNHHITSAGSEKLSSLNCDSKSLTKGMAENCNDSGEQGCRGEDEEEEEAPAGYGIPQTNL